MNVSSWTHRRSSIVLLPYFGQRRWEMAQYRRTPTFFLYLGSKHGIVAVPPSPSAVGVPAVLPNPSLKLSPNGVARWPSSAGPAAHFALAVQRATPSVPA